MAELVDAVDSKSAGFGREGSSPSPGTIFSALNMRLFKAKELF